MGRMSSCLSAAEIDGYARKSLSVAERAEAEAHLSTCRNCREALVEREVEILSEEEAGQSMAQAAPRIGERVGGEAIGHYRLLRELGRGGQGQVYLAEDTRLPRLVALKLLRASPAPSAGILLRFQREAAALSKLEHPGICTVFEAGIADSFPFIAMRYLEGRTLAEDIAERREARARGAPLSGEDVTRALSLVERAARALHAAHRAGLIHRDLKPGNIMVTEDGSPVLLDFGLVHDESGGGMTLTRSGDLLGTPAYMSPEQLSTDGGRIDARSDVYSLGVTLYEALTLRLPFDAPTAPRIYRKILQEPPPDPTRDNRFIPRDLKVVVETALEKDRSRRYQTAIDLAEDLRRVRESETILARPAGPLLRLRRWAQRNPVLATSLSSVFLILVTALAISLVLLDRVRREKDAKDDALAEKQSALTRAEGLRLVAQSSAVLSENPGLALLLALEGERRIPGLAARNAIMAALSTTSEFRRFSGHGGGIYHGAFNPAGDRVATASADGTARIWEVASGREQAVLRGHAGQVITVGFFPDGRRILTASSDRTARIWNAETGAALAVLGGHEDGIESAAISGDGSRVATASHESTVRLWKVGSETAALEQVLRHPSRHIRCAGFSRDGLRLLTYHVEYRAGEAYLWDAGGGTQIALLSGHTSFIADVRWSPSGDRAATASFDGIVRVWNGRTGREVHCLTHGGAVRGVCFTPDEKRVVTGDENGTVRIWDAETGAPVGALEGTCPDLGCLTFSPDGSRLAAASNDRAAHVWAFPEGKEHLTLRGHLSFASVGSFSPDGDLLLTYSADGIAKLWFGDGPRGVRNLRGHSAPVFRGAYSPDGRCAATSSMDGTIRIWETSKGRTRSILHGHDPFIRSLRFTPNGEYLLSGSRDFSVKIWQMETGKEVFSLGKEGLGVGQPIPSPDGRRFFVSPSEPPLTIRAIPGGEKLDEIAGHTSSIQSADWSPDGASLATLTRNGTVRVWDKGETKPRAILPATAGEERSAVTFSPDRKVIFIFAQKKPAGLWSFTSGDLRELIGHSGDVVNGVFSRDGRRFLTASADRTARLWSSPGGEPILTLAGHEDGVTAVSFSPDDSVILTASLDGTARLWEASSGKEIVALRGHRAAVVSAAFSPDGRRILTTSQDGTARIWPVDPVAAAEEWKPGDFTPDERARFEIGSAGVTTSN